MGRFALIALSVCLAFVTVGCGSAMRRATFPEHAPARVFEAAERALRTQFPNVRLRDAEAFELVSAPRFVGGSDAGLLQTFLKVERGPADRGAILWILVTRKVFDPGGWFGLGGTDGWEDDGRDDRAEQWIERMTRESLLEVETSSSSGDDVVPK